MKNLFRRFVSWRRELFADATSPPDVAPSYVWVCFDPAYTPFARSDTKREAVNVARFRFPECNEVRCDDMVSVTLLSYGKVIATILAMAPDMAMLVCSKIENGGYRE